MSEEELAAIEARLVASTDGEWVAITYSEGQGEIILRLDYADDEIAPNILEGGGMEANLEFTAHAHNTDIPALLAEVRRLKKELEGWEDSYYLNQ